MAGHRVLLARPGDGELLALPGDGALLVVLGARGLRAQRDQPLELRFGRLELALERRDRLVQLRLLALALEHARLAAPAGDVHHAALDPEAFGRQEGGTPVAARQPLGGGGVLDQVGGGERGGQRRVQAEGPAERQDHGGVVDLDGLLAVGLSVRPRASPRGERLDELGGRSLFEAAGELQRVAVGVDHHRVGELAQVAVEGPLPAVDGAHPVGQVGRLGDALVGQGLLEGGAPLGVGAGELLEELAPLAALREPGLQPPDLVRRPRLLLEDLGQTPVHALDLGRSLLDRGFEVADPGRRRLEGLDGLGQLGAVLGDLLAQPVAPVVGLLELDLALVEPLAQPVDLGGGLQELGADRFEPPLGLGQGALGGAHLFRVPRHRVGRGGQLPVDLRAPLLELGQGGGALLGLPAPALGQGPAARHALGDLLHPLAAALQELLAALDGGAQVGDGLVTLGHRAGQAVELLAAGGQLRLPAVEVGGEARRRGPASPRAPRAPPRGDPGSGASGPAAPARAGGGTPSASPGSGAPRSPGA